MSAMTTEAMDTAADTTIVAPTEYRVDEFDLDGTSPLAWRGPTTADEGWTITPIIDANGGTIFEIRVEGDDSAGMLTAASALNLAMALITEASMAQEAADTAKATWGR